MTLSILTSDQHRSIAVDTRARPEYGDTVNRAVALSAEFNELHREFPLLLRKTDEAPGFVAHAILGFEKDENLFVEGDRWITTYIPATLARGPFSLGYIRAEDGDDAPPGSKASTSSYGRAASRPRGLAEVPILMRSSKRM